MPKDHPKSAQPLYDLLARLKDLTAHMPFVKQTPQERRARGPLLFDRAAELTGEVRFVLCARPALYEDLPEDGAAIAQDQDLADAYNELRCHFQTLARLCEDSHLYYQAEAVRRSKLVLDHVIHGLRGAGRRGGAGDRAAGWHRRRAGLLLPAYLILREIRGHLPGRKIPRVDVDPETPRSRSRQRSPGRPHLAARFFASLLDGLARPR